MCSSEVGERGEAVQRTACQARSFQKINAQLTRKLGEASLGKIRENRVPGGGTILLGSQAMGLGSS